MIRRFGLLVLSASVLLFADGGTVLLHQQTPSFVVTVFASPTPPHAGIVDVSVLLQSSETLDPVLDADVQLGFTKNGSHLQVRATHDQTQNKLLYAASVDLDDPGDWRYTVSVRTAGNASAPVTVLGAIAVSAKEPALSAYWSYLALPFLCLAVFALHQWLRWRKPVIGVH